MVISMKQAILLLVYHFIFSQIAVANKLAVAKHVNDTVPLPVAKFATSDNIFEPGLTMPSFEGKSVDGRKISYSDYKGKVLVINFWFVYCAPCLAEMPVLNTVKEATNAAETAFLSITYDSAEMVSNLHKLRPFNFDKIVEAKALLNQFKITGYPRTIVVDRNGIVRYIFRGGIQKAKDLQDAIAAVQKIG